MTSTFRCLVFFVLFLCASAQEETDSLPNIIPDFKPVFCFLPADSGPCDAVIPSWFFNPLSRRCEMFIYGGCLGNQNRFDTLDECQSACRDDCSPVLCLVNPCDVIECEAFPDALCVPNTCIDCDADFFVGTERVDCTP